MAIYPVKGCRRVEVESAFVGKTGLQGDREYMIVRETTAQDGVHEFISQRHKRTREEKDAQSLAALALVTPEVRGDVLRLSWRGSDPIIVDGNDSGDVLKVKVHNDVVLAVDQGERTAAWLTEHLAFKVKLVKASGPFHRLARQNFMRSTNQIAFQDAYPLHWIMQESVDELSKVMGWEIPWTRFRPNIVAEGGEPQVEHEILEGRIGELPFVQPKPCTRCPVTTVDQEEGRKTGNEPLTSLSDYKKWARTGEVIFGENLLPLENKVVRVGDSIDELSARSPPLFYGRR